MDLKNLLYIVENNIATITINRPDKLNALNHETLLELDSVIERIKSDEKVYVVIITGAGEKAFVAGADIVELSELDSKKAIEFSQFGQSIFDKIENMNKPVIAAVNGFALGGGCELALACHIRLSSDKARFGQPEVNLGIIPGYGGTQRLARQINKGRAFEYILTGDMIPSNDAFRIGLVNRVYASDELMPKAIEMAQKIISKGSFAVSASLKAINAVHQLSLEEGLKLEAKLFGECCDTEEFKEGTAAFLEKRKPDFRK
ncbi:Enoyl-CoA hydratase [hydrothermal vent metagenome]|uniref:Enoyl-CoA hydratase n=1 Tax=hydrothermal vent metagenome TaxID=652676 RepID=A0A3B1BRZ7_9ZZZZ